MGAADAEISLRPLSLRPGGGGNPFASFALGAGLGLKNKVSSASQGNEKKKPRGEVRKYSSEFLMRFAETYTRLPTELQFSNLEVVLDPNDPERDAQRAVVQKIAAEESDERDWRSRPPAPAAGAGDNQQQQYSAREAAPTDPNAPKIQRATDVGKTAWAAGNVTPDGAAQALRKVKGILNKLTPEKFERLQGQLIPLVSSYEVLEGTIRQVFENAVAQPTFVAMYADLCAELDAVLPEFEGAKGELQTFKKMLANTCQEEYEATEAARQAAAKQTGDERELSEKKAKQRLLGNVRLIAELFKKDMVNDRIMLLILGDLMGPGDSEPSEDSLEGACELIATAGAALEASPRSKARLAAAFQHLARLAASKNYASRIRFVVRDIIELRSQHWVARRETFTAKKIDDIRTEAQAELGIIDMDIAGLSPLPGLDALPGIAAPKRPDEMELFPAFRGQDIKVSGASANDGGPDGKFSTLLGEFLPLPESVATPPEAPGQAPRAPRTDLSIEDRSSLGKSLFSDFLTSRDIAEAVGTAQELVVPGFGSTLVTIGIEKAFDSLVEAEQTAIVDLIVQLAVKEAITAANVRTAVEEFVVNLEDISLDVPAAPRVLGRTLGLMASNGLLGLDVLAAQAGTVEGAEPRRGLVAAALLAVKEASDEVKMMAMVKEGQVDVAKLLERDEEFEQHLPTGREFAQEQGLLVVM